MALETFLYDSADYLTTPERIHAYLEAELEDTEMPYMARALETVIRARGGVAQVHEETGVEVEALAHAIETTGAGDRKTVVEVMEAYRRRMDSDSKVA